MRKKLIVWLFDNSQKIYIKFKTKEPWNISSQELLTYAKDSFGYHLGKLLKENNFEFLPKVEKHDCYHLITGYSTKVEDEIALQYVCFGNGKKSFYLFCVILIGTMVLPEYYDYYIKSYKLGKDCNTFHDLEYKKLLNSKFSDVREIIFNKKQLLKIQQE